MKFVSLHGSVYPELFYICKMNDVQTVCKHNQFYLSELIWRHDVMKVLH